MRPASCLHSPHRALYRVFVYPTIATVRNQAAAAPWRISVTEAQQARSYAIRRSKRNQDVPLTAAEMVALEDVKHDPRFTTAASVQRSGRSRLPRDHEITDPQIMVHEKEMVEGPLRTQFVLTKIEPHESLRMVTPYVPATKEAPQKFAVCKIVNKADEVAKLKQSRESKQKAKKVKEKTIEVNWGIDANDLRTKFIGLKKLMDGPSKVTVRFGKKKGSKVKPDYNDQTALIQKVIQETIKMGGREMRPMEGAIQDGAVSLLFASKHVAN
ncbi:hypothetical protein CC79DRAFT_1333355 [Sarocladium strictum]